MANNQVFDFIDRLDGSNLKHIVMLYEEPEYARQVQIRFLQNGLKNGDCCVYDPPDDENLSLTKNGLLECGVEVERYEKEGVLQFHKRIQSIQESASKQRATMEFMESIKNTYFSTKNQGVNTPPPRIRGVGSMLPFVFAHENVDASSFASELVVEKIWQSNSNDSFEGTWMCIFEVHDIQASMEEEWMEELITHHDAVIFLPKLANGIALDTRK
jgi:hypothetical protein